MATPYSRGRSFEYRTMTRLRDVGFYCMRSPQSKGIVDVIAVHMGTVLFVQCKMAPWHGIKEWNEFFDLSKKHGAIPVYVTRNEKGKMQFFEVIDKKERYVRKEVTKPLVLSSFNALGTLDLFECPGDEL